MQDVRFGFQAAAADVAGVSDQQLYSEFAEEICPRYSSAMRKDTGKGKPA